MARKQRIHYPGAVYHAIARGNNRDAIFCDSDDKFKYLDLLKNYKNKYGFQLFAYALMDNHIHLMVKVNEYPLSKIMQGIQLTYTQYFNNRYQRVGHVFEQRYKAFLCENYSYLIKLLCYIHQNPVRANMSDGLNYSWSSHQFYNHRQDGLVQPDFILDMLHQDRGRAIMMYRQLIDAPLSSTDLELGEKGNADVPATPNPISFDYFSNENHNFTLDDLAEKLSTKYCIEGKDMLGKCRVRKVVKVRNQFIFEAVNHGLASKVELARLLELDPARITHVYQEMVALNINKSIFE